MMIHPLHFCYLEPHPSLFEITGVKYTEITSTSFTFGGSNGGTTISNTLGGGGGFMIGGGNTSVGAGTTGGFGRTGNVGTTNNTFEGTTTGNIFGGALQ